MRAVRSGRPAQVDTPDRLQVITRELWHATARPQ